MKPSWKPGTAKKRQDPSSGCRVCPCCFSLMAPVSTSRLPTPDYISAMIVKAVKMVGINTLLLRGLRQEGRSAHRNLEWGAWRHCLDAEWACPAARRYVEHGCKALRGAQQSSAALSNVGSLQVVMLRSHGQGCLGVLDLSLLLCPQAASRPDPSPFSRA